MFAIIASCKKNPVDNLCTNFAFNLDLFEQNLIDAFDGNNMGYSFAISEDGNLKRTHAAGMGRAGSDGVKNMSVTNKMQLASVSKMITTVATLHVLKLKNMSVNDNVEPYLPSPWTRGPGINNLKFIDLISQQAGFAQVGSQGFNATKYDSLQAYIAAGSTQPKVKQYTNTHHAMMRVILPRLWDKYRPGAGTGGYDEDFCANTFKTLCQELIFEPIGLNNIDMMPPGNNPNLAYAGPNDNGGRLGATTDFTLVSGGIGWNMSTIQLAQFWAYVWFSNELIDGNARQIMEDNEAGLWNTITGDKGEYYCKLGGWNFSNSPQKSFESVVMNFPNDYQVVIITNSPNSPSLRVKARDAFDDAYACQ